MNSDTINKVFSNLPVFKEVLLESESPEIARERLLIELRKMVEANIDDVLDLGGLEYSVRLSCARVLRQFLAKRTVKITGFDMVKLLWAMVHGHKIDEPVSEAFFEDLYRILSGLAGKDEIYSKDAEDDARGRDAAIKRSEMLNKICKNSEKAIASFACGLDEDVVKQHESNRERLMKYYNCSEEEFNDYKWQLNHIIRNVETLEEIAELSDSEKRSIKKAKKQGLPFGITPYYASLFDPDYKKGADRAIRAQVLPPESYVTAMGDNQDERKDKFDFMREADTSPVDLITRRYARIAIFKPYNTCSQICVYCQRNWEIDDAYVPEALASKDKIDKAIEWIAANPSLTEILVTGGDPLVMPDDEIENILRRLSEIKSLRRIRIGTRTPVVLPQRFTDKLVEIISRYHVPGRREITVVTHFEHSLEITPEAMEAVQKIRKCGMGVYNQVVYTLFNSRRFELAALRKWLRLIGVEPYYSFNAKGKKETDAYRVPLSRLQQEAKEEARLLPGMERTDEPVYNVPGLGKNYLRAEQNHLLLTILPDGRRVYEFHPWEKFIRHAKSYIHHDIPVYDYLQKLKQLGEDPEDYKTIYYYF
ncbi:MAG: KamA family radical SAM protein [Candidatus Rifleibacteriota bacterium]